MRFSIGSIAVILGTSITLLAKDVYSQDLLDKKVTLHIRNENFFDALNEIAHAANTSFSYTGSVVPADAKVSLTISNAPLREVLERLLAPQGITYLVFENRVILRPFAKIPEVTALPLPPTDLRITGMVTDNQGVPLQGVTVLVGGKRRGTLTDVRGNYQINAEPSDTLFFSYLGYRSQEIPVAGKARIDVQLVDMTIQGRGIVVVGYGTQRKEDISGAISSINSYQLKDQPVASLQQSLEGISSGIQITQNSGSPGKNAQVRIRGLTSINNSDPLYVVDGVPLAANGINAIDPDDIASVEVLKDASSQAIYGSRGANGVVLIETKKGSREGGSVSFNVYKGFQQIRKKLDMLNSPEFVELNTEAYKNAGLASPWQAPSQYRTTTDWQDALFRTAPISNYDVALSGGSDKVTYRLSGGYFQQDGIIIGSDYKRLSLRLNSTFKPIKHLEVGESMAVSKSAQHLVGEGATARVDIISALKMDPTVPLRDSAGNFEGPRYSDDFNPIASIYYNSMNNEYDNWGIVGGLYAELQPINGLSLRSAISIDLDLADNNSFIPKYDVSPAQNNPIPSVSDQKALNYNWTWDNTATYRFAVHGKHHFKILAGVSQEAYTFNYLRGANQGQPGNDAYLRYLDAGTSNPTVAGNQTEWTLLSYLGRLNYDYKGTYLVTAAIRRDGSSKFGENNKYGNFPSLSAGWVLTNEPFLPAGDRLDYLKVRGSWGIVGNQNSAGDYDFSSTINNFYYPFGLPSSAALTAEPGGLGNPDLKWEQVRQWDVGVDFRLWKSSLSGTVDYYNKKTNNMLLSIPILFESGYATGPLTNVASMFNEGVEFSLDYALDLSKDWSVDAGVNLATLHNKVLSLQNEGAQILSSPNLTEAGHSAAEFYGYVYDGIFQTQKDVDDHATQPGAAPGDIRFKDVNGDGVINDQDETFLGSPLPKFTYGFRLGTNYHHFDLNLAFSGVYGNRIYQSYKYNTDGFFISNYNMEKEVLSRWHGEGTSTTFPRLDASDPNNNARESSFYLADGSYLRLRNVTVGYNLPQAVLKRCGVKALRVYVSAQNLLTFTHYDGYDPEIGIEYGGNAGTLNLGIDDGNYPQPRTLTAGVNLTL